MLIAKAINYRLTAEQKKRLCNYADCVVALRAASGRWCFRIDNAGRWQPIASFISADVEVSWTAEGMQINGEGGLLRELNDIWQCHTPYHLLADVLGYRVADELQTAVANWKIRDMPITCGVAAASDEVAGFIKQASEVEARIARLSNKIRRLENKNG